MSLTKWAFGALLSCLAFQANALPGSDANETAEVTRIAAAEDQREAGKDVLLAALSDGRAVVRDRAVLALARLQDGATVPALLPLLRSDAPSTRETTAFALGEIADTLALAPLGAALADGDMRVRLAAAEALGKLGDPRAVPLILRTLEEGAAWSSTLSHDPQSASRHPEIRGECLLALARGGRTGAGEQTAEVANHAALFLADRDPAVRWKAAYAIERLYTVDPAPTDAPEPVVEALVRSTGDRDSLVRAFVARAIGRTAHGRGSAIVTALRPLLGDRDWRVRVEAARALGRVGGGAAAGALTDYLAAPARRPFQDTPGTWHPEAAALEALVDVSKEIRDDAWMTRTARAVEPWLAHPTPGMRWRAAGAMFAVEGAGSRGDTVLTTGAWLPPVLEDRDWTVRSKVAAALGAAKKEVAIPLLVGRMADSEREPRELGGIAEGLVATASPSALPLLVELVKSGADPVAAAIAVEGIGQLSDSSRAASDLEVAADLYARHADETWSDARMSAVTALEALAEKTRDAAARGRAASTIRGALGDANAPVRKQAAEALAKLNPATAPADPPPAPREPEANHAPAIDAAEFGRPSPWRHATIHTSRGDIDIEFAGGADEAPLTVRNFVSLARRGFYDRITFHRVVPNFVIQAGCPRGDGWGGPGYTIRCEYNRRRYGTGAVGMALSGKDTGGSQFFITHSPTPRLDGRYTIFGQVTRGQDVVDAIREGDTIKSITIRTE